MTTWAKQQGAQQTRLIGSHIDNLPERGRVTTNEATYNRFIVNNNIEGKTGCKDAGRLPKRPQTIAAGSTHPTKKDREVYTDATPQPKRTTVTSQQGHSPASWPGDTDQGHRHKPAGARTGKEDNNKIALSSEVRGQK